MNDFKEDEFKSDEQHSQLTANTHSIASDIAIATDSGDQADVAPLGTPPKGYDVRAVYDSRPVQGYDFNIAVSTALGETNPFVSMTVPNGYIAVLRAIHHSSLLRAVLL